MRIDTSRVFRAMNRMLAIMIAMAAKSDEASLAAMRVVPAIGVPQLLGGAYADDFIRIVFSPFLLHTY